MARRRPDGQMCEIWLKTRQINHKRMGGATITKDFFFSNDWPKVLRVFMSIYIIHNPMVLFQSTMGTFQPVAAAMGVFP